MLVEFLVAEICWPYISLPKVNFPSKPHSEKEGLKHLIASKGINLQDNICVTLSCGSF